MYLIVSLDKPEVTIQAYPSTDVKELDDVKITCESDAKPELVAWK